MNHQIFWIARALEELLKTAESIDTSKIPDLLSIRARCLTLEEARHDAPNTNFRYPAWLPEEYTLRCARVSGDEVRLIFAKGEFDAANNDYEQAGRGAIVLGVAGKGVPGERRIQTVKEACSKCADLHGDRQKEDYPAYVIFNDGPLQYFIQAYLPINDLMKIAENPYPRGRVCAAQGAKLYEG